MSHAENVLARMVAYDQGVASGPDEACTYPEHTGEWRSWHRGRARASMSTTIHTLGELDGILTETPNVTTGALVDRLSDVAIEELHLAVIARRHKIRSMLAEFPELKDRLRPNADALAVLSSLTRVEHQVRRLASGEEHRSAVAYTEGRAR